MCYFLFNGTHSGNNSTVFCYIIALIDSPCLQCSLSNLNVFFFVLVTLDSTHKCIHVCALTENRIISRLISPFSGKESGGVMK